MKKLIALFSVILLAGASYAKELLGIVVEGLGNTNERKGSLDK